MILVVSNKIISKLNSNFSSTVFTEHRNISSMTRSDIIYIIMDQTGDIAVMYAPYALPRYALPPSPKNVFQTGRSCNKTTGYYQLQCIPIHDESQYGKVLTRFDHFTYS
jgi:hypothetical protein